MCPGSVRGPCVRGGVRLQNELVQEGWDRAAVSGLKSPTVL